MSTGFTYVGNLLPYSPQMQCSCRIETKEPHLPRTKWSLLILFRFHIQPSMAPFPLLCNCLGLFEYSIKIYTIAYILTTRAKKLLKACKMESFYNLGIVECYKSPPPFLDISCHQVVQKLLRFQCWYGFLLRTTLSIHQLSNHSTHNELCFEFKHEISKSITALKLSERKS